MDLQLLNKILPKSNALAPYIDPINAAMHYAAVKTPLQKSLFLANCFHETAGLTVFRENLRYKPAGLAKTWPKRFANKDGSPNALALSMVGPSYEVKIANLVYGGRMGNRGVDTMDGWMFRGGGMPMLTGRSIYEEFDNEINLNGKLVEMPHLIEQPYYSAMAAGFFWKTRNLGPLADAGKIKELRIKWNGGTIGLTNVVSWHNKILPIAQKHF